MEVETGLEKKLKVGTWVSKSEFDLETTWMLDWKSISRNFGIWNLNFRSSEVRRDVGTCMLFLTYGKLETGKKNNCRFKVKTKWNRKVDSFSGHPMS